MKLRDLMTLRQPADVAAEAQAQAAEDRILAPLDALATKAREVVEHYREAVPNAFDDRRNRRADGQVPEGLEVNEWINTDLILTGNSDVVCERGDAVPYEFTNTLAIYPKPSDLPYFELDHKCGKNRGGAL